MATSREQGEAAYQQSLLSPEPMDPTAAAERLRDIKRILDRHAVVFFLASGTCLGAVREQRFIPWDDEMDVGSVIGLHGLTDETVERVIAAFTQEGYYVHIDRTSRHIGVSVVKSSIRADWTCHRIIGDKIYQYPAVKSPASLFTHLKEIDFVGEKFLVPNPPEEYLQSKYGPDWITPKGPGFEIDVVQKIADGALLGGRRKLGKLLTLHLTPWRAGKIRVIDRDGKPVHGAEVVVTGVGRSTTNRQGYARFYVPEEYYYAVIVRYGEHEEVLYSEVLTPGGTYVYRPGPEVSSEEHYKAGVRAMALTAE